MYLNGRYTDVVNTEFVFNSFLLNNMQWAYVVPIYFLLTDSSLLSMKMTAHFTLINYVDLHAAAQTVLDINFCDHITLDSDCEANLVEVMPLCLLVYKVLVCQTPEYTANLLTLATDIPFWSSLRSSTVS